MPGKFGQKSRQASQLLNGNLRNSRPSCNTTKSSEVNSMRKIKDCTNRKRPKPLIIIENHGFMGSGIKRSPRKIISKGKR